MPPISSADRIGQECVCIHLGVLIFEHGYHSTELRCAESTFVSQQAETQTPPLQMNDVIEYMHCYLTKTSAHLPCHVTSGLAREFLLSHFGDASVKALSIDPIIGTNTILTMGLNKGLYTHMHTIHAHALSFIQYRETRGSRKRVSKVSRSWRYKFNFVSTSFLGFLCDCSSTLIQASSSSPSLPTSLARQSGQSSLSFSQAMMQSS